MIYNDNKCVKKSLAKITFLDRRDAAKYIRCQVAKDQLYPRSAPPLFSETVATNSRGAARRHRTLA